VKKVIKSTLIFFILLTAISIGTLYILVNYFPKTVMAPLPEPAFKLYDEGTEKIVRYENYGDFLRKGTTGYRYVAKKQPELAEAVGEGIYPNTAVYRDPFYKKLVSEGKLKGSHWDYMNGGEPAISFYKWATTSEDPGVKQFYTALALENSGLLTQAVKAYYAVLVQFPKTVAFTYWNTPWYPAKVVIDKIRYLTERYPLLRMKLDGASVKVENGFNLDPEDDIFTVDPGKIAECKPDALLEKQDKKRLGTVTKQIGYGKVNLIQYSGGDWQLMVNDKPFIIKGVAYAPTKIGESPDEGTISDWSGADYNKNNIIDGPYEAWVDKNRNNRKDEGETTVGDFELMKNMGVNTVRIYDHKMTSNKELLGELYRRYGIMVLMGDLFGAYAVGSGASWYRGTNYSDPKHRERLKERVREMVQNYKDEPYILMWVLGNETNYGVANSSKRFPVPFYKFANEVARMIKELDPNHPVALCNGDTLYLDIFAEECHDIDVFGANSYRGWQGFGFWSDVKTLCGKPVLVTEYGASAYWKGHSAGEAEEAQAEYHMGAWDDIFYNTAGYGSGNALGGVIFEWVDEWWKAYEPQLHDMHNQWPGPVKGGWIYEEWLGITSQGEGFESPYLRQWRKAYHAYKERWNPTVGERLKKIWHDILLRLAN
jgi:hypothetical protein